MWPKTPARGWLCRVGARTFKRRQDLELGQVAPLLRAMAARPGWFMDGLIKPGAAGAAALRFRERVRTKVLGGGGFSPILQA